LSSENRINSMVQAKDISDLKTFFKQFLVAKRHDLNKKKEDFMALEKEVNAKHERKISGEE